MTERLVIANAFHHRCKPFPLGPLEVYVRQTSILRRQRIYIPPLNYDKRPPMDLRCWFLRKEGELLSPEWRLTELDG